MPTVKVFADDVLVHSVQTDHRSIDIRGDGPNERGFLSVKPPVKEPPQVKVPPGESPPDEKRPVEEPPSVKDPPVKEPPTEEPPSVKPHHRRHDTRPRAHGSELLGSLRGGCGTAPSSSASADSANRSHLSACWRYSS
jgi:hypothetical protein